MKSPPPYEQEKVRTLQWGNRGNVQEGSNCARKYIIGLIIVDATIDKVRSAFDVSPSSLPYCMVNSAGRWITVQGRFKMQAPTSHCAHTRQHTQSFSGAMERSVGSTGTKTHSAPLHTKERGVSSSVGRWRKVQGNFKMQAHEKIIPSGVVMDTAAFKVGHSIGCDIDATTLRAARARLISIGGEMEKRARKVLAGQVSQAAMRRPA